MKGEYHVMAEQVITTCAKDCPDACQVICEVENGKITKHVGDKAHPVTNGTLCYRGSAMLKRVYHKDRILKPKIKKNGEWKEASWDSALDLITEKLNEYKDKYGSLSTLFCTYHAGTGILKGVMSKSFWNLFGGVTTVSGGMSMEAAITAQVADFGNVLPNLDIPESKNIIIWGKDAVVTNPHLVPLLKDVQKNGTKLYVIDPLNNETAKLADKHLQIRPGSDGLLAIGIAKVILEKGKVDQEFTEKCANNFSKYKDILDKHSLDSILNETDISKEDIDELASVYTDKKPTGTWFCLGPQYSDKGESNIRLIDALAAMSGNVGIKGGGCQFGINGAIAFDLSITDQFPAEKERTIKLPLIGSEMAGLDNPPLKFAWIAAHNPMVLTCNSSKVRSSFDALEFRVLVDMFMTKASESADVFLPTTTYLEESDVRFSYGTPFVCPINKVVEPLGECKSDFEIYQLLADRLGFGDKLKGTPDEWIDKLMGPLKKQGITLDQIRKGQVVNKDIPTIPYENKEFMTESKKFEFITDYDFKGTGDSAYPYFLIAPKTHKTQNCQVLPEDMYDIPDAIINDEVASKLNAANGDTVYLTNKNGQVEARVVVDKTMRSDCVWVTPSVFKNHPGTINELRVETLTDGGEEAAFTNARVNIAKT